jgi:hypothetical protein
LRRFGRFRAATVVVKFTGAPANEAMTIPRNWKPKSPSPA